MLMYGFLVCPFRSILEAMALAKRGGFLREIGWLHHAEVQPTAGLLRDLQAFSMPKHYSALRHLSTPAPRPPLTRAVGQQVY